MDEKKTGRPRVLSDEERKERRREQTKAAVRRFRERNPEQAREQTREAWNRGKTEYNRRRREKYAQERDGK